MEFGISDLPSGPLDINSVSLPLYFTHLYSSQNLYLHQSCLKTLHHIAYKKTPSQFSGSLRSSLKRFPFRDIPQKFCFSFSSNHNFHLCPNPAPPRLTVQFSQFTDPCLRSVTNIFPHGDYQTGVSPWPNLRIRPVSLRLSLILAYTLIIPLSKPESYLFPKISVKTKNKLF